MQAKEQDVVEARVPGAVLGQHFRVLVEAVDVLAELRLVEDGEPVVDFAEEL